MGPDVLFLRHVVSCIINNVKPSQHEDLARIYQWLAKFPKAAAVKFFASFPAEILDVIRQRFRAYAASDDNGNTVQAILALEYDLNTSLSYSFHEISKLLKSLTRLSCDFSIAQTIVRFASLVYADQDLILRELLVIYDQMIVLESAYPEGQVKLDQTDWFLLMKIPLLAGAAPTLLCFDVASYDVLALDELLEMSNIDLLTWIEQGLLAHGLLATTVSQESYHSELQLSMRVDWALTKLSETISSRIANCSWTDALQKTHSAAFSRAFNASLLGHNTRTTERLYDTCHLLNLTLDLSQYDRKQSDEILNSCRIGDWEKAHTAAIKESSTEKWPAELTEAIAKDDHYRIKRELYNGRLHGKEEDSEKIKALELAIASGSDNVAAIIAARSLPQAVLLLLKHGRVCAISKMLSQYSHWTGIIQDAITTGRYERLEDVLYLTQMHECCPVFPCQFYEATPQNQGIILKILGYHAMYTRDLKLLDWLCQRDLAVGAMVIDYEDLEMDPIPEQRRERLHPQSKAIRCSIQLPSLIDVAVQRNDLVLIDYFSSRTLPHRNSEALLHAVKANVHLHTIKYLIEQAEIKATGVRTQYGSAALRFAIRVRNYDLIRILAKSTDIHGLESVSHDCSAIDGYLDPMGEAILLNDVGAVNILLDNGGNPNALVAFAGLSDRTPRVVEYSALMRLTALLVAIDVGSLALVKLLVERGADVNRRLDMGLSRNPLQRAAEIGDIQMVEFLIEYDAIVDAEPAFGGGTALQLAAMSGHVGIATLLIERGADVNYPPARGPGRTAFEAAAEWCRPDVMYLLVQHGAQLDLEMTGDVEVRCYPNPARWLDHPWQDHPWQDHPWRTVKISKSQYKRAMEFAASRQEYASMNIVQSLYVKVTGGIWS